MSNETDTPIEQEKVGLTASELTSGAQPLTVNVPSGNFSNVVGSGLVNFYYPYLPQAVNAVISGVTNATFSGNVVVYNVSNTGWASVNNGGFLFQNGQYNARREGGGQ